MAPGLRPEVDEHVVGVEIAVFGVEVLRVEAHQRRRHRDEVDALVFARSAVGVVCPGNDADLAVAAYHI